MIEKLGEPLEGERMSDAAFDEMADVYEAMIDWPRRLAREAPFFRELFRRSGVQRVADVACGTGRHADMFHSWGLDVEGSDASPAMIEQARRRFGEPPGLRWMVRGFDQPAGPPESFDAVVCIGNSLALAPDARAACKALSCLWQAVRVGGVLVLHVLNLWKLPQGPCVWQKVVRVTLEHGPAIIVKGVHRCADAGHVDLVVIDDRPGKASMRSRSAPFLGFTTSELAAALRGHQAADVTFRGGYENEGYDPDSSTDLVMVAVKS